MLSIINSSSSYSLSQKSNSFQNESLRIERLNLINIFKLVIRDLIESSSNSVQSADNFDKNEANLSDFFDVFENILNHGFKGSKKSFYSGFNKNDYSGILDIVEMKFDSLNNNLKSIKDMSGIKTSLGKLRAWIRLLVMQKQLGETFALLIQESDSLSEIFESEALILSEEANIVAGLLIGLNGLDFSIDLKSIIETTLDLPVRLVNYSQYLREKIPEHEDDLEATKQAAEEEEERNKRFYEISNQKNYLEEINKTLKTQADSLSKRVNELDITNESLKNELLEIKIEKLELKSKSEFLIEEKDKLEKEYKSKYDSIYMDQATERETFVQSKNGLDQMYIELQKKILEESKMKMSAENELKTQQMMKGELECALKLMDHSLAEKQSTITKLREQMDQVKALNLEMNGQLTEFDMERKAFNNLLERRQEELKNATRETEELKLMLEVSEENLKLKSKSFEKVSMDLAFYQKKKEELEVDLSIEKNWRQELQAELTTQKDLTENANEEISKLNDSKNDNERLQSEVSNLKLVNSELERTLEEMGSKLGVSVEKMEDFKEATKQISEYQWELDEQVTICKSCNHEFNVARRKHHCRRCGRIFCHDCSDNKMPLPSFSKPVRVCDPCCDSMVQNCITAK